MTVLGQSGALEPEFEVGGGCGWVGLDCLSFFPPGSDGGWVGDKRRGVVLCFARRRDGWGRGGKRGGGGGKVVLVCVGDRISSLWV